MKEYEVDKVQITLVIHKAEDNRFWVESPKLQGCFSEGRTPAEAVRNFGDAMASYFDEVGKK